MARELKLDGRVALITGASRGIGAAVARSFADEGARLALIHQPTRTMTEITDTLAQQLRTEGAEVVTIAGDLSNPDAPSELVKQANRALGPVQVLVANAAVAARRPFHQITGDEWDLVLGVNARATWALAKAARMDLIATQGSMITVSSVMVHTGQPGAVHYTASKAAIIGSTRALARELGPHNVRVNAIAPGAIRTEHEIELGDDEGAIAAHVLPCQALKRRGIADDLAGAFVFLASDDSSFITGQTLNVDGGWAMQ